MNRDLFSKNILRLQILFGVNGFSMFFGVIYVLFLQEFLDSFSQISLLLSLSIGLYLVFEYITGVFADKYGRVKSIQIGHLFLVFSLIVFCLSSSFYGFLFALILLVLGGSFNSGSIEAVLFESLKKIKREKEYEAVLSRAQILIVSTGVITNFVAPYLFDLNIYFPFYVSLGFSIIGFICSLFLIETLTKKKKEEQMSAYEILKLNISVFKENTYALYLLLFTMFFSSVIMSFGDLFNQPLIFNKFGIELYGIIFAVATLFQTIILVLAPKIMDRLKDFLLLALVFFWSVGLSCIIYFNNLYLIIFMLGIIWSVGSLGYMFISSRINTLVEDDSIRASTHSFMNQIQAGFGALIIFIGGMLIDMYSLELSLIFLNIILVSLSLFVLIFIFYEDIKSFISRNKISK